MTKLKYKIEKFIHIGNLYTSIAQLGFADLLEQYRNPINLGAGLGGNQKEVLSDLADKYGKYKLSDFKKLNSIIFNNGADGSYPMWIGVDKKNKIKKIILELNVSTYEETPFNDPNDRKEIHDQFFDKKIKFTNVGNLKRIKLFDFKLPSGYLFFSCGGMYDFGLYYDELMTKWLDKKFFVDNNSHPIGLMNFVYSDKEIYSHSKVSNYIEPLSILLEEKHYPTKYLFEGYFKDDYNWGILENHKEDYPKINIDNKKKLSPVVLKKRLNKAYKILENQTKILFKEKFKDVFKIRKKEFKNFIENILNNLENKYEKKTLQILGNKWDQQNDIKEIFYRGYKKINLDTLYYKKTKDIFDKIIMPFKDKKYPVYLHFYSVSDNDKITSQSFGRDDDVTDYVKIVIEDLEGCELMHNYDKGYYFKKSKN